MNQINQKMTLSACISLVTGNLVGSGVFMLPAALAVYGSLSIIGWCITAIGATLLALCFAKLSEEVRDSHGGPHTFIQHAFGNEFGFWAAWGYWVLTWSSNTALLVTATSYLTTLTGPLSLSITLALQLAIWGAVTTINLCGVKNAARFEFVLTALKTLPIILIPIVALAVIDINNFYTWQPLASNVSVIDGLQATIFATMWAFIGVESATVPAKEVANPETTIGKATILGTLLAAFIYITGSIATIGVLGVDTLAASSAPYADLATRVFGGSWASIIAACAVVSCVGAFNGWTLVVARIAQSAAEQGLFPEIFAKTNQQQTPVYSILIASFCTLAAIVFTMQEDMLNQFNAIVDIAVTLILLIYLGCVLAYFRLVRPKSAAAWCIGIGAGAFVVFGLYASSWVKIQQALYFLVPGLLFRWQMRTTQPEIGTA